MIDGVVKLFLLKRIKMFTRGINRSDAIRAPHQMGEGVCQDSGISIPRNTTSIFGECQLLNLVCFSVRMSEHIVKSSVKA